jgi:PPOX class probable F420-dependent enzyme
MRLGADEATARFADARVARLATTSEQGQPHVVPIVFAVDGDTIYTAVDWKPKTTRQLRRLENIAANARVAVLVDHYADDWTQLWWARADGAARIAAGAAEQRALELLSARYVQYVAEPPPGPVVAIDVRAWTGWQAAPGATR